MYLQVPITDIKRGAGQLKTSTIDHGSESSSQSLCRALRRSLDRP